MRTVEQLISSDDPALPVLHEWLASCPNQYELLPPSDVNAQVLTYLQVSTHSMLGAIAYESGGLLIDHGWLRLLGSGHAKLQRNLFDWNQIISDGFLLIGDDVVGGLFAINGGGLGDEIGIVHYWAPDTLQWESLGMGHSEFVSWALTDRIAQFYQDLRWQGWQQDVQEITAEQCFSFYPYLWTAEGSINTSERKIISIESMLALNHQIRQQLLTQ